MSGLLSRKWCTDGSGDSSVLLVCQRGGFSAVGAVDLRDGASSTPFGRGTGG